MKTINSKILYAAFGAALLCAASLISSQSNNAVLAFEKIQGQDKTGKNCERKDTAGSSTFGKCESVCKDKELTRDAPNNRWVCKATKAAVTRPLVGRAPVLDKALEPSANPNPKRPPIATTKAGKAKN